MFLLFSSDTTLFKPSYEMEADVPDDEPIFGSRDDGHRRDRDDRDDDEEVGIPDESFKD